LLALSVSIQSQTGGNLAEILSGMSRIIRERFKLRRKAHALASEARVSAYVLTALPVLLLGLLWLISPGYYGDIWEKDYAQPVLGGAIVWMLVGDYIMYRMSRIRV
jgi:tight adherence protein B